jgi:hypothetical protein
VTAAPNSGLNQDTATWLGCLDRIIACGEGIAQTARIKVGEGAGARVLAAALLVRSISTAHAVGPLIARSHVVEARMLVRSMFENMFYLFRLARDDGSVFARQMQADDHRHRGLLGKAIEAAMGDEVGSRVKEIAEELILKSRGEKPLSPKSAIYGTEIERAYVYYKQLSVDAGHPSITALNRHLVESEGNEVLRLKPRIGEGEAMNTAFLASMALLGGCTAANTAFGQTAGGERLEGLFAEYHEIAARTHADNCRSKPRTDQVPTAGI